MRSRSAAAVVVLLLSACAHEGQRARNVQRAQLALARELAARRAWTDVVRTVDRIHADGGRSAETLTLRGVAYRELRLVDEADVDLRKAVALGGEYAPAHAALAVLLDVRGDGGAAEPYHRRAIELAPEDAGILNDWGFSLFLRGRHAEAVAALRRAAELAPLDRRIRNNYGFALARTGDFTRAARQFDLGGTRAEAHNNLGFAYESAGNLPQAFDAYLAAARLDPSSQRTRANLEHAAHALNRAVPPDLTVAGAAARRGP